MTNYYKTPHTDEPTTYGLYDIEAMEKVHIRPLNAIEVHAEYMPDTFTPQVQEKYNIYTDTTHYYFDEVEPVDASINA